MQDNLIERTIHAADVQDAAQRKSVYSRDSNGSSPVRPVVSEQAQDAFFGRILLLHGPEQADLTGQSAANIGVIEQCQDGIGLGNHIIIQVKNIDWRGGRSGIPLESAGGASLLRNQANKALVPQAGRIARVQPPVV